MEDQNCAPCPASAGRVKAALDQRRSAASRSAGVLQEIAASDAAALLAVPQPARGGGHSLPHAAAADDSDDSDDTGSSVVISSDSDDGHAAASEARPAPGAASLVLAFQRLQGGTPAGSSPHSEDPSRRSASPAMYSAASSWAPSSAGSEAVSTASAPRLRSPGGGGISSPSSAAQEPGRQLLFSATPQQQLQVTPLAAAPASALLATRQVRSWLVCHART
jgi:hypothetical protein